MSAKFHFSLGPVQGFVAQSRRTRDLWAGSWLLSYLAESAIAAAERAGAVMILPHRGERDHGTVTMQRNAASFGGFPNVFAAEADDPIAAARAAENQLRTTWRNIADAVWETYVAPAEERGAGTRQIWDRQTESFWEVAWVVGGSREFAARKNVRLVDARVEPGVHCSLINELQELSGHFGAGSREPRDAFWEAVGSRVPGLDLDEGERLSAVALIKRLFPRVSQDAVRCDLGQLLGWPSTAWLAAAPWIASVLQEAPEAAAEFARSLDELKWHSAGFRGEQTAARKRFGGTGHADFAALDGPLFFDTTLSSPRSIDTLKEGQITERQVALLRELYDVSGAKPEPFYAVLLMDGDRLGKLLGAAREAGGETGERAVSAALARFSGDVDEIVRRHDGYTVYAGGDDVLALLPADRAVGCAGALAQSYPLAFASLPNSVTAGATISGAIVFAHYKRPLRSVLRYAHHLVDDVAKDATGRGALAIGILLSSGEGGVWSAPWEVVRGELPGTTSLTELVPKFGDGGELNPSYLYNLRQRLAGLFDEGAATGAGFARLPPTLPPGLIEGVARAEYGRTPRQREPASSEAGDAEPADASESPIPQLLSLTRRWRRFPHGKVIEEKDTFSFGGVRVARFLARVAVEESATAAPEER